MDFKKIEGKWQKKWEKSKIFQIKEGKKKKLYVLEMFPYPSGSGLHMGHAFNYVIGDVYARFMRMQGFNVLYPMGYDAFGLPAENAAIKSKTHPKKFTQNAIDNFIKQQKALGLSYDWTRTFKTCDQEYYKWNQFLFLKLLEKGLVYRKKAGVNWCPECRTVLANEQVHNGKCWRHKETDVTEKQLEQWFIKTTKYADELLKDISKLEWPSRIKVMQENWIGKSFGTEIVFKVNNENWEVFTTRPDTLFGVTFMVVSAQHPKLMEITTKEQKKEVENFVKRTRVLKGEEADKLEKDGVFTGSYAEHPITKEKIPVYAANFVVADYGSGMVMGVPAHDQRDFEFAKKYNIQIKQVIAPYFVDKENPPREGKKNAPRINVQGIVRHPIENKVLQLKWKGFPWKTFVIGGAEKDEKLEDAVRREVIEETGYKDIESIERIGFETRGEWFAEHKDENRYSNMNLFLVKLKSLKQDEISEDEKQKHELCWIDFEKIKGSYENVSELDYILENLKDGTKAYTGQGILINSGEFNETKSEEAKDKITDYLKSKNLGKKTVNYKLKDWLVSRQRYWGTPIPVVYCDKCGVQSVSEKDLPVKLPEKVKFGGGNPLETNNQFLKAKCPKCKGSVRRETDTMDTFFDSSWYFLRYTDAKNKKEAFGKKKANYWMPVDRYIGGAEHACMHLIYARFFVKALRDMNYLNFDEPFVKLFNQGMIHGEDGYVMSKSRGNIVDPTEIMNKFGADTLRLFLVSIASPDKDFVWNSSGIESIHKLVLRVYNYFENIKIGKSGERTESRLNKTIKEFTEEINNFNYNLAIIKLRQLFEKLNDKESKATLEKFLKMFSLFCPHMCEELWSRLGNKKLISLSEWSEFDEKKINEKFEKEEEYIEKVRDDILNIRKLIGKEPKKLYIYSIPPEKKTLEDNKEIFEKALGVKAEVYAVNDKNIKDPEGKAKKAKPGRPAIYIE